MYGRTTCTILLCILSSACGRASYAIDVTANTGGGPTPQTLAASIVDAGSGVNVVVGSAGTTINTGGGTGPTSDARAFGSFSNGITPAGTLLPAANQNANGDATYAGGIGVNAGVCLCTGVLEDEPSATTTGRGSGVLGPNNGLNNTTNTNLNPGEIVTVLGTPDDLDFANATGLSGGGDAAVLEFDIEITSPGFLRVSFIFGSDEHPAFIDLFGVNDSIAIMIDGENIATITKNSVVSPFRLFEFVDCGPPLFIANDIAPSPAQLVGSAHAVPSAPLYDIEFGGFTKRLTRETSCPLAPGTYKVKFVVQDVADRLVDAGAFIEAGSLKLYNFLPADFNLDGSVDIGDFAVLQNNYNQCGKKFTDGDANGDGCVNIGDFSILQNNYNQTGGNRNLKFDFDRDNQVNGADLLIWQQHVNLNSCASRFEGDADGDGDVDGNDNPEDTRLADPCGGGGQSLSGGNEELVSGSESPSAAADIDQDGDVDDDDVELFGQIMAEEN